MKRSKHPPPIGPVTILRNGFLFLGKWRAGTVRHHVSGNLIQANVKREDEGIVWIRGHHTRRSVAVSALRAAYAMRAPTRELKGLHDFWDPEGVLER